jgi:predicted RNA-binding Zn-ribbon protein involved in translation (DUF1610 family)
MKTFKVSSGKTVDKTVKTCPVCGSADITLWIGASAGVFYSCKKCGYHGPLVVEEDVKNE